MRGLAGSCAGTGGRASAIFSPLSVRFGASSNVARQWQEHYVELSGRLAQLEERHVYTVDVGSSSLSPPTKGEAVAILDELQRVAYTPFLGRRLFVIEHMRRALDSFSRGCSSVG